eukprot:scaffold7040_cov66-Phaeocystis_antarctica.AAC.7
MRTLRLYLSSPSGGACAWSVGSVACEKWGEIITLLSNTWEQARAHAARTHTLTHALTPQAQGPA